MLAGGAVPVTPCVRRPSEQLRMAHRLALAASSRRGIRRIPDILALSSRHGEFQTAGAGLLTTSGGSSRVVVNKAVMAPAAPLVQEKTAAGTPKSEPSLAAAGAFPAPRPSSDSGEKFEKDAVRRRCV